MAKIISVNVIKENLGLKLPATIFEEAVASNQLISNSVNLIGFGFDGTACFRKGTKNGPDALRDISYGIESYSPYLDLDTTEIQHFVDLGNLSLGESEGVESQWQHASDQYFKLFKDVNLVDEKIKIITLGGEHSISYAPIVTMLEKNPELVLIHLDAHADLRDGYEGYHYSHASIIRRSLDHFGEGHKLIQYGIRSGTKEEYQWMRENRSLVNDRESFLKMVEEIDPGRPIYLTFDLDYFDPGIFPGTGTPEPGGEDFHSFISLMKVLKDKNFVGADIVELSPEIDSTGNSSVFAAKVVREVALALS